MSFENEMDNMESAQNEEFLNKFSKKLMEFKDYKDNPNRNDDYHKSLADDSFVAALIQFAEVKYECLEAGTEITMEDIEKWRPIFEKLVLLDDGIIHTQLELDILDMINELLGDITNILKVRYYDNYTYINYAISAENQDEITHNQRAVCNKPWMWFVRYGNRNAYCPFDKYAQFDIENAALGFNTRSEEEVNIITKLVEDKGFTLNVKGANGLGLRNNGCWVAISSFNDIDKLKKAIRYCFQRRLNDFVTMILDKLN